MLDGPWVRHHPNGAIAEQGAYVAGHKDGTWRQANGSGVALGEYVMAAGTGTVKQWYEDGAPYSEQSFRAGLAHGAHKVFAPDGTVMISAMYKQGVLDGPHWFGTHKTMRFEETFEGGVRRGKRSIWQSGLHVAEEEYDRRGKLDGPYVLRRSSRALRVKGEFSSGRRIGEWQWWDRDNNKEREGTYVAGKKDGQWLEWWEGKLTFSGEYKVGKPHGTFVYFDRGGNELGRFSIVNGTGTMITFHANKKPSSKTRLYSGSIDGPYQEFNPRGKLVVEGRYKADQKHGVWKEWTLDGTTLLVEQSWKRGKLDGPVKKYVDGKLAMETTYVDGKVEGPYTELRNGKPAVTGQFVADLKDGTWTIYAADGAVLRTATYKAGVLDGPYRELADSAVVEGTMVAGRRSGAWTRTDRAGTVQRTAYTTP
jgi:antitoxin component YwqK of YwqJK toxin-antitoxin module